VDAEKAQSGSRDRIGGDVLEILQVLVNDAGAAAVFPHAVCVAAQQIFGSHQADRCKVRVLIELGPDSFESADVL
jgi:hypothetical protein